MLFYSYHFLILSFFFWDAVSFAPSTPSITSRRPRIAKNRLLELYSTATVGPPIAINEQYPGLRRIHTGPDIFIIDGFLEDDACADIIAQAKTKGDMKQSPFGYTSTEKDVMELISLAATGPVTWLALIVAWFQTTQQPISDTTDSLDLKLQLLVHVVQNWVVFFALGAGTILAFTKIREASMQALRTSTSTTLAELDTTATTRSGPTKFVKNAIELFNVSGNRQEAKLFEAPTVIRYEPDQSLAPHYDANRSPDTVVASVGGQTLATLIVYLNDVKGDGGVTRFGKLGPLEIQPTKGSALLFFPADARGVFDERTEHEGCPIDGSGDHQDNEKWIARIWRHADRVQPPYGLREETIASL